MLFKSKTLEELDERIKEIETEIKRLEAEHSNLKLIGASNEHISELQFMYDLRDSYQTMIGERRLWE